MKVGMVGLGNFGTALGNLIANNGHDVVGWEYDGNVVEEVNRQHTNSRYLPGVDLSPRLVATDDVAAPFQGARAVFVAIPTAFICPTLEPVQAAADRRTVIVNLAKGIDQGTGLTAYQTLRDVFPNNPTVVLSGPSVANEFSRGMPTVVVIASQRDSAKLTVARLIDNVYFRVRFSSDEVGVELGGILKNIYAIGLGLFDGKDIRSINFRSVYLTIALEEMARIGVGLGAKVETFLYVSGMGDLLATALSEHSHNRRMGEYLAQGLSQVEIKERMGVLPEGYNTLQNILYIAEKRRISVPLAKGLWDVIHGRYEAERFIRAFIKDFVE
jgi:glycerol-3-phosphate dehydrogenase (NAD(P)+)